MRAHNRPGLGARWRNPASTLPAVLWPQELRLAFAPNLPLVCRAWQTCLRKADSLVQQSLICRGQARPSGAFRSPRVAARGPGRSRVRRKKFRQCKPAVQQPWGHVAPLEGTVECCWWTPARFQQAPCLPAAPPHVHGGASPPEGPTALKPLRRRSGQLLHARPPLFVAANAPSLSAFFRAPGKTRSRPHAQRYGLRGNHQFRYVCDGTGFRQVGEVP